MTTVRGSDAPRPLVSVIVLSQGDRPTELHTACESVRAALPGESIEFIVVWNTASGSDVVVPDLGSDVRHVYPGRNLGIPAGRNLGAALAAADILLFLDDDASLHRGDLSGAIASFDHPRLAVVALRIVDQWGRSSRRHVPRLGGHSSERPGPVALFLGGASLHRRSSFLRVGAYPSAFTYAMEESDLALRLTDNGYLISYDPTVQVLHPRTEPGRHPNAIGRTARNRVWLAHRNLPLPIAAGYVVIWTLITCARTASSPHAMFAHLRGIWAGLRAPLGPRRPIGWKTVWRLCRVGRPPFI